MEIPLPFNSFSFKKEKYWSPESYFSREKNKDVYNEERVLRDLEEILTTSFNYRMVADVDVAVFLSGGIDSSLVAALLQKNSQKKIKTFTIGFTEKKYDEAPYAKKIAEYLGTDHKEYYVSLDDLKKAFDNYAEIFDEPFGDSSGLPTYLLAKLACQEVKVALSGDGGDELFLGYSKYYAVKNVIKSSRIGKNIKRKLINVLGPRNLSNFYNVFGKILPLPKHTNLREKISKLSNLLEGKDLSEMFDFASSYWQKEEMYTLLGYSGRTNIFNQNYDLDIREQMQIWDIKNYLTGDILVKTDRTTMAHGLEAREPFLDHNILDYLGRLPMELRYKDGSKYWLKKILAKYLPKELFDRPKTGFQAPIFEIFKDSQEHLFKEYLNEDFIKKQGIFNYNYIESLKDKCQSGKYFNPDKLWLLVAFQMWYKKWLKE